MEISPVSRPGCIQFCCTLVGFTATWSAVPYYFVLLYCHAARCSAVPFISVFGSLSLSLTHTHTHTHTQCMHLFIGHLALYQIFPGILACSL